MRRYTRFAVVGAGHGGQAMAGYLAHRGYHVNLFNKSADRIEPVAAAGGVHLTGVLNGFGPLGAVTTDPAEALRDVQVVMVVVPANAHGAVARQLAPHLTPEQIVILNPGRTGGALEFARQLRLAGAAECLVAEAQTFLFASRICGPAQVVIHGIKRRVPLAALPGRLTRMVLEKISRALPQFTSAVSVLETSLNNIGAIFHPAPTLLNAARIEDPDSDFEYYRTGISPSVAKILEAMDAERLAVARAYGVHGLSAKDWLARAYGAQGDNLYEALQNNEAYRGILAPTRLDHRYIHEDVPTSLVPMVALGRLAGIPMPTMSSIVSLGCVVAEKDFWRTGRTLSKLGLKGWTPREVALWAWGGGSAGDPDDVGRVG